MKERVKIFQERKVYTHTELYFSAKALLDEAKEVNANYLILFSLIGCAFSLEAYLNFLGDNQFKFWNQIEKISTQKKLALFHKHFGLKPDYSRRPYQTVKELWRFRNFMAHAITEYDYEIWEQPIGIPVDRKYPKMKWEKYCTIKNADIVFEDIKAIINVLHSAGGMTHGTLGIIHEAGGHLVK